MSNTISGFISVALPNTLDNENIIDSALSGYLPLDGSSAMLGDLDMNTHNIKNLANATSNDEAVNLGQVNTTLLNYVTLNTDQTITGIKTLRGSGLETRLTIQKPPLYAGYSYLNFTDSTSTTLWDFGVEPSPANNMYIYNGSLAQIFIKFDFASALTELYTTLKMNNNLITNLLDPVNNQDASTKFYVDNLLNNYVTTNTAQTITGIKTFSGVGNIEPLTTFVTTGDCNIRIQSTNAISNEVYIELSNTKAGTQTTSWGIGMNDDEKLHFGYGNNGTMNKTDYLVIDKDLLTITLNSALNMNTTNKIINLATPTLNTDATTKLYVDNAITTGLTNYVTTNTAQTITAVKTFDGTTNKIILNSLDNKTENLLVYSLLGSIRWTAGIFSTILNTNNNYTIRKDNTTPILTIDYNSPSLSLNNYKIIDLATPTLNTDATTKLYVDNAITTGLTNYVTTNTAQTITAVKTFDGTTNKIILNSLDNKTENLLVYSLLGNIRWTAGIFSTVLNTNNNYTIRKDNTTPILTIDYNSPSLSLNNYKIIDLATPTLNTDATTKLYVDNAVTTGLTNYVTTNTAQTITGIKTFGPSPAEASIRINKLSNASFGYVRHQSNGVDLWDNGTTNVNNHFYWYYFPTALMAMTLTTSGRLGIGTAVPTDKLQVSNGSFIIDRTDALPALINMTTNSNTSALGSVISMEGISSRAQGIKIGSTTTTNKKFFMGRPYGAGGSTDSRFVLGYVAVAGQDPAVEVTGGGVRQYTPLLLADGDNSRVGINTITPLVPCHITGNTRITSGTLDMSSNKITNLADGTATNDVINFGQWKNGKTLTTINNFTYDNEDVIELSSNVARTITFNNLNNYYKGKRFTMIITNTGLVSTVFTFDITGTGTFPGGTTTKTQTLPVGNKALYTCVIENLNYNYLYINPTSYLL
jgi:hypothetical protein